MGFSIQKGFPASIADKRDFPGCRKFGNNRPDIDRGIREQFAVIGNSSVETELIDGDAARLLNRIAGDGEVDLDINLGEPFLQLLVATGVKSAHPAKADDTDIQSLR